MFLNELHPKFCPVAVIIELDLTGQAAVLGLSQVAKHLDRRDEWWMNERMNELMNELMNEWMNEWMNELIIELLNKWMNK